MTHLDIQAKVRRTSAADGSGVDISGITGDWTLVLEVMSIEGTSPTTRFQFADSVDAFSNNLPGPAVAVIGNLGDQNYAPDLNADVKRFTWNKRDFPTLRFGTASAVLRCSLSAIGGTGTPAVTYQAYVEY